MCSGLKSEILSIGRAFYCIFFIHLFLHNLSVLNSNLSNNILYLVMTFTFKLAKQNGHQNVNKTPYFLWFIAHESTIYGFWKIFIREIYIECLWKEITFI